ncbi:protein sprouty homolog 2 isoform X2 [Festucalex cinctus]
MDPRNPISSDGGGGHRGRSSPDDVRPQPRPHDGALALDHVRITGSRNEYTEGPAVARRTSRKSDPVPSQFPAIQQDTREERPGDVQDLHANVMRPPGAEDTQTLGVTALADQIVSAQPAQTAPISNGKAPKPLAAAAHRKCERCGRCRCAECRRPRALPSCWVCGRRCVCSLEHAVECCTCVCCVKGLFYHCSSDDEDTCADKPFSCTQAHCCARWTAVTLLAVIFPCLLCYLPARGCVAACQRCYDRATRPGCRCTNSTRCQPVSKPV